MPLAAALLAVVPSRESAQTQGALQGGGRYVLGGECQKAWHEHSQPVEMEKDGSPAQHALPFGPARLDR